MRPGQNTNGLPDHLVYSIQKFFNNLDSEQKGLVSFKKLHSRWKELAPRNLPPSFLAYIEQLTPPHGMLNFESFMSALRLSLNDYDMNRLDIDGGFYENGNDRKRNGMTMGLNGLDRRLICNNQGAIICSNSNEPLSRVIMRKKNNGKFAGRDDSDASICNGHPSDSQRAIQIRFRPASVNSSGSVASSGMSDVRWRNSHMPSPHAATTSDQSAFSDSTFKMKHERFLEEEKDLIHRGMENASKLLTWYNERLESLQKRVRLINNGTVMLEPSVHEEKLNYLRAHISELNRRIISIIESSERGFPTHSNLQVKTMMPQPTDDRMHYLQRQNQMLTQELYEKDRMIEDLRKKFYTESKPCNGIHAAVQSQRYSGVVGRPSASERLAGQNPIRISVPPPAKVHDTLM